jgi:hypothetical protein
MNAKVHTCSIDYCTDFQPRHMGKVEAAVVSHHGPKRGLVSLDSVRDLSISLFVFVQVVVDCFPKLSPTVAISNMQDSLCFRYLCCCKITHGC